jgi:hypothetical protein
MTFGVLVTLWTVRIACALYVAALGGWINGRDRLARAAWTLGCLFYLAHAAAAFHFYHGWSHAAAVADTERQTAALFGTGYGAGVWFNYAFTIVWAADILRLWIGWTWPRWFAVTLHSFMAFMFINATVVFASGATRWLGVAAAIGLALNFLWRRTSQYGTLG